MLKFLVFDQGKPAAQWPIRNAYLLGPDNSALRGTIVAQPGMIVCEKREPGVSSLVLQVSVGECGELTLQTCHLPERDEPYIFHLELARHRLMILYNRLEDWAMFDLGPDHPVARKAEAARKQFIEALCTMTEDPAKADQIAKSALISAIEGSEELAVAHADLLLTRRRSTGGLPRYFMGAGVPADQANERIRSALQSNFDFVYLPVSWRQLAPQEGDYRWAMLDNWIEWASRSRLPVVCGPVISFDPQSLPDWLFIWEHDYNTVRDVIYEHVETLISRYRNSVAAWNLVSGLHINNHFTFTFEQLIDLTRMCVMLSKKIQPLARALVEIRQPFGEYFAVNARSIPPKMFAELLIQSAVGFDAIVVRMLMGQSLPGQYTRDLMQVSNLLDDFGQLGKSLHIVVGAPSEPVTPEMIAVPNTAGPVDANCGFWRKPWSPPVQAKWLEAVYGIALSKPMVESVIWQDFTDHSSIELPLSGLITEDMQVKQAFRRAVGFRKALQQVPPPAGQPPANPAPAGQSPAA